MRYNPVSSIRWELDYIFQDKNNKQGKEQTTKHNIGTSLRWSRLKSFNLQLGADFIYFKYPFSENTPIAYEMLEGLKPGKNATWNITFQKDIYKNLQLNFRYSGRISENSKAIHTGQFELRANF
jgi:outer membrane receptor for ferrienterochelin and colicin